MVAVEGTCVVAQRWSIEGIHVTTGCGRTKRYFTNSGYNEFEVSSYLESCHCCMLRKFFVERKLKESKQRQQMKVLSKEWVTKLVSCNLSTGGIVAGTTDEVHLCKARSLPPFKVGRLRFGDEQQKVTAAGSSWRRKAHPASEVWIMEWMYSRRARRKMKAMLKESQKQNNASFIASKGPVLSFELKNFA